MTRRKFLSILERRLGLTKKVFMKKQKEYAQNDDVFYNFRRAEAVLNTTKEKALCGMMSKHLVSVLDIVEHPERFSHAQLDEKIGDLIVYLCILEAMLIGRVSNNAQ